MDIESKLKKIARIIVKDYKSAKSKDIRITEHFDQIWNEKTKKYELVFVHRGGEKEVRLPFGEIDISSEGFGNITERIANLALGMLKVNKNKTEVVKHSVSRHSGSWYAGHSYNIYNSISIIPLCKEFIKMNKRLVELKQQPILAKDWTYGCMSGKRSQVFDKDYNYFASSKEQCEKVLAYLKGKKKLNGVKLEESVDNEEDRRYAAIHEIEWDASYRTVAKFTDSTGKVTTIW